MHVCAHRYGKLHYATILAKFCAENKTWRSVLTSFVVNNVQLSWCRISYLQQVGYWKKKKGRRDNRKGIMKKDRVVRAIRKPWEVAQKNIHWYIGYTVPKAQKGWLQLFRWKVGQFNSSAIVSLSLSYETFRCHWQNFYLSLFFTLHFILGPLFSWQVTLQAFDTEAWNKNIVVWCSDHTLAA